DEVTSPDDQMTRSPDSRSLHLGSGVYSQQLTHLLVEESCPHSVRLYPLAIDYELRDGALAHVLYQFVDGAGGGFDVDFLERDVVLLEEVLGLAAIATPERSVNGKIHRSIVARNLGTMADRVIGPSGDLRARSQDRKMTSHQNTRSGNELVA